MILMQQLVDIIVTVTNNVLHTFRRDDISSRKSSKIAMC